MAHTPMKKQITLDGLPQVLGRVSTALTSQMRQIRQMDTDNARIGRTRQSITFVHVTYFWLMYPAALAFVAAVFLTVSTIFSAEHPGGGWKSSMVPLLAHDLDLNWSVQLKEFEKTAKRMRASLEEVSDFQQLKVLSEIRSRQW